MVGSVVRPQDSPWSCDAGTRGIVEGACGRRTRGVSIDRTPLVACGRFCLLIADSLVSNLRIDPLVTDNGLVTVVQYHYTEMRWLSNDDGKQPLPSNEMRVKNGSLWSGWGIIILRDHTLIGSEAHQVCIQIVGNQQFLQRVDSNVSSSKSLFLLAEFWGNWNILADSGEANRSEG